MDDLGDLVADLDLDSRLAERFGHPGPAGRSESVQIVRTPMPPGQAAVLMNRVDLTYPRRHAVTLVEKAVSSESNEVRLWRGASDAGLTLRVPIYSVLEPAHQVIGGQISVLYFPYIADLDRPRHVLRPEFRKHRHTIVSAVADFNGRNLTVAGSDARLGVQPFTAARPTVAGLSARLGIPRSEARELRRAWDAAHRNWQRLRRTCERLPRCFCHNDVAPWNVVCRDGQMTTFSDLGLSGTGPVGSDLHTVFRWSGRHLHNDAYHDDVVATYLDALRPYVPTVDLADIRLAAWATFYLRYTDLRFSSARHLDPYRLAIHRMREL